MLRKERKERRKEARKKKTKFAPEYNNGTQVKTFEEFYGTGNERFNNKFITIKEIDEQKESNE